MTTDQYDVILDRLFGTDPGPSRTHRRPTPQPPAAATLADIHQQPWVCGDCAGTGWVARPDPAIDGGLVDVHCPTCDLDDPA